MTQRFFVNANGQYIGSFDGPNTDKPDWLAGTLEVKTIPTEPDSVWDFPNSAWKVPKATIEQLLSYSSNKRWEKENGGFDLVGMHIATDDRSKTMITGARIKADNDPNFTTPWKTPDGTFSRIDAVQITAISNGMLDHVAACFDTEELLASQIASGTITTYKQIDTAWNS